MKIKKGGKLEDKQIVGMFLSAFDTQYRVVVQHVALFVPGDRNPAIVALIAIYDFIGGGGGHSITPFVGR